MPSHRPTSRGAQSGTDWLLSIGEGAAEWTKGRAAQGQTKIKATLTDITEIPGLPDDILVVLRTTRAAFLNTVKEIRALDDVTNLGPQVESIVAAAITETARRAGANPAPMDSIDDVKAFCRNVDDFVFPLVKSTSKIMAVYALVTGAHTLGASVVHAGLHCLAVGLLANMAGGTAEIYAVTSLLANIGHPEPESEALRIVSFRAPERPPSATIGPLGRHAASGQAPSDHAAGLAHEWFVHALEIGAPIIGDRLHRQRAADLAIRLDSELPATA